MARARSLFAGVAVVALTGAALVAFGCGDGPVPHEQTPVLMPPATAAAAGTPVPGPSIPELTEDDRTRAREIALADQRIQALLAGQEYTEEAIGVWHEGPRNVGAGIVLSFSDPISVEGDFPYVDYGGDESGPAWEHYREGTTHIAAENVERLHIRVDLEREQVVEILPW